MHLFAISWASTSEKTVLVGFEALRLTKVLRLTDFLIFENGPFISKDQKAVSRLKSRLRKVLKPKRTVCILVGAHDKINTFLCFFKNFNLSVWRKFSKTTGRPVIRPYFWLLIRPLFFEGSEVAVYKTLLFSEGRNLQKVIFQIRL